MVHTGLVQEPGSPGDRQVSGRVVSGGLLLRCAPMAFALLAALAYAEEMLPGSFELTVNSEQNISLTANDASLQAIVTELGAQLGVQVVGTLSDDRHVTTQLTDVTVGEVLRQIGDSYVLLSDAEDGKAKKIFLLGKGRDGQILDDEQSNLLVDPNSDTPQPGFQFEFDPSAAPIQEEETGQSESSPDHQ